MNSHTSLLLALFCAFTTASYAQSDYERELKQLIDKRNAALAAAVAPINDRFKLDAKELLRRATQVGDTVAAQKINEALGDSVGHATEGIKDLHKQLMGTTWKADPSTPLRGGLAETLTFTDKTVEPGGLTYQVDNHNTVTITFIHGDKQVMTLVKEDRPQFTQGKVNRAYDLIPH